MSSVSVSVPVSVSALPPVASVTMFSACVSNLLASAFWIYPVDDRWISDLSREGGMRILIRAQKALLSAEVGAVWRRSWRFQAQKLGGEVGMYLFRAYFWATILY